MVDLKLQVRGQRTNLNFAFAHHEFLFQQSTTWLQVKGIMEKIMVLYLS